MAQPVILVSTDVIVVWLITIAKRNGSKVIPTLSYF